MAKFLHIIPVFLTIAILLMLSAKAKKCNCGKRDVSKMEKIQLKDMQGKNFVLLKDTNIIGDGSYFTKVYHAEVEMSANARKCVALKFSLIDVETKEKKGGKGSERPRNKEDEEKMKKQKLNQEKEWRSIDALRKAMTQQEYKNAFIQIIAKGTYKKQKTKMLRTITETHYFTIMDLGSIDYYEYLRNEFYDYEEKDEDMSHEILKKFIRQPAAVMSSMHKVLIHMDIKPENFLYTKYDDKLKAIDFGGSLILPRGEGSSSSSNSAVRADLPNYPMKIYTDDLSITDTYACPEMYTDFYDAKRKEYTVVTTKCDIWAIGIMIYEMALSDVRYDLVARKNSDGKKLVDYNLDKMRMFFKNLIRRKYPDNYLVKKWDNIWSTLRRILRVREYFPKMFHLMMACLDKNPTQRPTAKAIVDFLDGKCHFASEQNASNDQAEVAPFLTLGQLKKELRKMIVDGEKRVKKLTESNTKNKKINDKLDDELDIVGEYKELLELAELPYREKAVGSRCEIGEQVGNMNEILDSFKSLQISTDARKKSTERKDRKKSGRKSGEKTVNKSGSGNRKPSAEQKQSSAGKQSGQEKKISGKRKQSGVGSRKSATKRKSSGKKPDSSPREYNVERKSSGHKKSHGARQHVAEPNKNSLSRGGSRRPSEQRSGGQKSSNKRRPSDGHKSSNKRRPSEQRSGGQKSSNKRRPSDGHKSSNKRRPSDGHKSSNKRRPSDGHKSSNKRRPSDGHKSSNKRRPSEYHRSTKSGGDHHKEGSIGKNGRNSAKISEQSGHSFQKSLRHHKDPKALSEHDSRSNHRGKLPTSSHRSH